MKQRVLFVFAMAVAVALFVCAPALAVADEVDAADGQSVACENSDAASAANQVSGEQGGLDGVALPEGDACDPADDDAPASVNTQAGDEAQGDDLDVAMGESTAGDDAADAADAADVATDVDASAGDQAASVPTDAAADAVDAIAGNEAKYTDEGDDAADVAIVAAAVTSTTSSVLSEDAAQGATAASAGTASQSTTTATTKTAATQVTLKAASSSSSSATENPAYAAGYRNGHAYILASGLSSNLALTASGDSVLSCTLKRTANQFWKAVFTSDGCLMFISQSTGKALGVTGGKAANGTKVGLFKRSGSTAQKWTVTKLPDGSYAIYSALSGGSKFVLDIDGASKTSGTKVQVYRANGTAAQKWKKTDVTAKHATQDKKAQAASMPTGTYAIASGLGEALVLTNSNANAANTTYKGAATQKWTISVGSDGYATIKAADGRVLDVAGAQATNGANVQLYASNGSRAQKWIVTKNSNGTYKLESALWPNLVLDVSGASKTSGSNVQLYASNATAAQKWDLRNKKVSVPASCTVTPGYYLFWTSSSKTLCLDVSGAANANGTSLQLYRGNGSVAQHFRIVKKGSYYRIEACCAPGKRVDFDSGFIVPGTKVQTWNSDSNNSLFSFQKNSDGSYRIINVASGLALGVSGSAKSGAAVKGSDGIIGKSINFTLDKRTGLLEEGTYTITTQLSGSRVVSVVNSSWSSGAKLDMESYTKGLAQKWYVRPVSGSANTYTIESLSSGMRLSGANNAQATQSSSSSTLQRWVPQTAGGNAVVLKNASNGKALDVSGASTKQGAAVMNWSANGTNAQKWVLNKVADVDTGIYEFRLASATGKSLDVDVSSSNVQVWSRSGGSNQRWYYDASKKIIVSIETGKVLDVAGASKTSGTNVQQYESNDTAAQKWTLKYDRAGRFKAVSSLGTTLVLSSAGNGDGANVTSSTDKSKTTQRWRLQQVNNNKYSGFKLITSIISNGHGSLNPSYVVIHETANPGATAKNHRDYWSNNDTYAVHYVLDWTGNCYYCVPENRLCWQVGNGNKYVVGIELCHATNKSDFNKVWDAGVEWARWQLAKRGWGVDRLISHYDCTNRWGGSDHTDPIGYFAEYGKSWSQFKSDVSKALARGY